jgi:Plasma-membrane choline transporter
VRIKAAHSTERLSNNVGRVRTLRRKIQNRFYNDRSSALPHSRLVFVMSWLLSQLWNGTTTTTSSPASSSSPPPYHPVARQQRVIIDEQHLQSSSPSSFHSQQYEESSPSFVVSRTLPVVIADNVLGPPPTSSSSRSDGADGDFILETTPLVSQQRQRQVAAPATNGMSRGGGGGGGGGGEQDEQELRMPPGESSSSSAIIDDESSTSMPVYRDVPFAILFALHCCIMAWLGIFIAPLGFDASSTNSAAQGGQQSTIDKEEEQKHHSGVIEDWNSNFNDLKEELKLEDGLTEDDMHRLESFIAQTVAYVQVYPARIFVLLILPCIVLAFGAGWLVTALGIRPCPKTMIYSSLIGCIVATFGVLVAAFVGFSHSDDDNIDHRDDTNAAGNMIFCIISLALLGGMAYSLRFYYWPRVSFCAVNLRVALIGIGRNYGTYIVAFAFAELGFVWVLYWIYVLVGTMAYTTQQCRLAHSGANFNMSDDDYDDVCDPSFFMILLFCFSLYWTNTVIMVSSISPSGMIGISTYGSCL